MFCWETLQSYLSGCRWRKPKLVRSVPSEFVLATPYTEPLLIHRNVTRLTTSKVPAVQVNESDMYSVLDTIFGIGEYEVALDRDVYRITGRRKLTPVGGNHRGTKVKQLTTTWTEREEEILWMMG